MHIQPPIIAFSIVILAVVLVGLIVETEWTIIATASVVTAGSLLAWPVLKWRRLARIVRIGSERFFVVRRRFVYDADGDAVHAPDLKEAALSEARANRSGRVDVRSRFRSKLATLISRKTWIFAPDILRHASLLYPPITRRLTYVTGDEARHFISDLGHVFREDGELVTDHEEAKRIRSRAREGHARWKVDVRRAFPKAYEALRKDRPVNTRVASELAHPAAMRILLLDGASGGQKGDFGIFGFDFSGGGGGTLGGADSGGADFGGY